MDLGPSYSPSAAVKLGAASFLLPEIPAKKVPCAVQFFQFDAPGLLMLPLHVKAGAKAWTKDSGPRVARSAWGPQE